MCGFFASNDPKVNFSHEKVINNGLKFRGPDFQSGLKFINNFYVYHSRLAIIGLKEKYNQPYACSDGSILLYNGEIFNFKSLAKKYSISNCDSDTHLLSEILSIEAFNNNELDGFFAFIRISKNGEILNCSRDHFGVKPLFYYKRSQYITFSSEPNVIRKIFNLKVNQASIREYKLFRAPIFSQSYFSGIESVNPGHCLIKGKYFDSKQDIPQEIEVCSEEDIENSIIKSIDQRYISDAPVGLLLSGGIDSNLIRHYGKSVKYYAGGFENDYDINFLKSGHKKIEQDNIHFSIVDKNEFKEKFKDLLRLRGEPLSVPNEVILSIISSNAKKDGIKVLLSGEGADELYAGYDRVYLWAASVPHFNLKKFCAFYCYSKIDYNSEEYAKLKQFFEEISFLHPFEQVRQFFIKVHLPLLFRRLDFSLMSSGIEGREPLASKTIFNNAIRINYRHLMDNELNLGKKVLREITSKFMGKEFAYAKKVGFPIDLKNIFLEYESSKKNSDNISSYDIWFNENLKIL